MILKTILKFIFLIMAAGWLWFVSWMLSNSHDAVHVILAIMFAIIVAGICVLLLVLLAAQFEAKDWKL